MTTMTNPTEAKIAEAKIAANLQIAKIRWHHGLKKNEDGLPPVAQDLANQFCTNLDSVMDQNTPEKIQTCKEWILQNIVPSKARTTLLGDYLVTVSKSIIQQPEVNVGKLSKAARNRLDILLVISDVSHAVKFHAQDGAVQQDFAFNLKPHVEELIDLAISYATEKDSLLEKKLKAIINFWAASQVITVADYKGYRNRVVEGIVAAQGGISVKKRTFNLPGWFGDKDALWYQLPASYMLDPMIRKPDEPIVPSDIHVLNLNKKPASERVQMLLNNYFEDMDLKYLPTGDNPTGETEKYKLWLDSMGNLVKQNKETKQTTTVCNTYGWSPKFCREILTNKIPKVITERRAAVEDEERRQDFAEPSQSQQQSSIPHPPLAPSSSQNDGRANRATRWSDPTVPQPGLQNETYGHNGYGNGRYGNSGSQGRGYRGYRGSRRGRGGRGGHGGWRPY